MTSPFAPPSSGRIQVSPSLMCADFLHLADAVARLAKAGVDMLHFDIMDAHFVPNMPLGLGILAALRGETELPFDVHLMVTNNDWFIDEVAQIGAEAIAAHVESATHLDRTLSLIRSHGVAAGAAINPATPLSALDYVLDRLDYVLVMTVNPGYAGQKLVPATLQKIADLRAYLSERGLDLPIEVDGNVSFENIPKMVAAGATVLVAGTSSIYKSGRSVGENMTELRAAIDAGCQTR